MGMMYTSTRDNSVRMTSAEAIVQGISKEGGLCVPMEIPKISLEFIRDLGELSYAKRAEAIFSLYLTDYTKAELEHCTKAAYESEAFPEGQVCELAHLVEGTYMLELWHGPTCAFKDMALQILPHLMVTAADKAGMGEEELVILVATSGDTGKAALEGFKDVPHTKIMVFYPADGVSPMQQKQMVTQAGENVVVCGVKGNFDQVQSTVKKIFTDKAVGARLEEAGKVFSSANSINWGRLAPQIVYYISSYAQLVADGEMTLGEQINVVVPTGNFGNILAAYMAKEMGLPIKKLICASNANNVLTDFLRTGVYDKNREFFTTLSPSMDILISSNLERLVYWLCDGDDKTVKALFQSLSDEGKYQVPVEVMRRLKDDFYGGFCSDEKALETIGQVYKTYSYTSDPHTAVALGVYQDYKKETGDNTKTLVVSTASPYKFSRAVLEGLGVEMSGQADEFDLVDTLAQSSGYDIPESLSNLKGMEVRFNTVISEDEMESFVMKELGL